MKRNKMLFLKYLTVTSLIIFGDTQELPIDVTVPEEAQVYNPADPPYWLQTPRPMPPGLEDMFKNEKDDHISFCLNDFRVCISAETQEPLCAINKGGKKKRFQNICDMMLENCRKVGEIWRYYNDDEGCKDLSLSFLRSNDKAIARILKRNSGPIKFLQRPAALAPWAFFDAQ